MKASDKNHRVFRSRCLLATVAVLTGWAGIASPPACLAQSVSNLSIRPFVTAWVPVVGRNGVGGVDIDADGVLKNAEPVTVKRLTEVRLEAATAVPGDLNAASHLRKISLKGLQQIIDQHRREGKPLPDEVRYLAGLQRVTHLFVYPESKDIVLAGPAEGWRVDTTGCVVGRTTGSPVIELDDLLVALRSADAAGQGQGITCSIDPTEDGLARLQKMLNSSSLRPSPATIRRMEQLLGDQQIALTGIDPASHFARTMVAADYQMKRLAMGWDDSPNSVIPSYLELLRDAGRTARNATPRWWMATNYGPLLKDPEGLAWQLQGPGVQVLTQAGYLDRFNQVRKGKTDPTAVLWADTMTSKYETLSRTQPVFGSLRNCMDLAVLAALIRQQDLAAFVECDLSLLYDERQLQTVSYSVPRTIASRASLVQSGRSWIVSVSGGVDIDSWSVLQNPQNTIELATTRHAHRPPGEAAWWWD